MTDLPPAPPPDQGPGTAAEGRVPIRLNALKDGDTFLIADALGDVAGDSDGMFHNDTRVLSRYALRLGGTRPSLLSAAVSSDNVFFTAHMTNRPLPPLGGRTLPEGVIHVDRTRMLWEGRLYERIKVANYGSHEARVPLSLAFAADFRDMFEVRGEVRPSRGTLLPPTVEDERLCFRYEGLDRVRRTSMIAFSERPARLVPAQADFVLALPAGGGTQLYVEIGPEAADRPGRGRFRRAGAQARWAMRARLRRGARLESSGRLFDEWTDRSWADLALLTSELPTGPYPYAGMPWFSAPFGRDAIVTSLQTLWLDSDLARGVLRFLACHQAWESSAFRDAQPGKIMHETRKGEMTSLGELPFGQYYGGVDTTPLFVVLAGAYAARTGDIATIDELWPALQAAMDWIDRVAGANPDGFLTYRREAETGLANQGWKDSGDSIFHADGRPPQTPIALVEVQGYVYAARRAMAMLARRRNDPAATRHWLERARALRRAVEARFWMDDLAFYGIALDGAGELCRVRASNPGHLLFAGLPSAERAAHVVRQLSTSAFDSGWGLRTLAAAQVGFNPMSYHNGSVWPHDTALCTAGMARYGERDAVVRLIGEMFEGAVHFEMRLPELFCGFPRHPGEPPIAYPVACLPQAWAAGSVFMLLQACLGLRVDGWRGVVHIDRPRLPDGIDRLAVRELAVGGDRVDLMFQRAGDLVVAAPVGPGQGRVPVLLHF